MKKIIAVFIVLLLICSGRVSALNRPSLRCVAVLDNGSVQLTWIHPTDLSGFNHYDLYYSLDGVNFTVFHTVNPDIPGNPDVNSAVHLSANANVRPKIYYYMTAVSNSGISYPSDTLATIEFYLTNPGNGLAQLNWNPPITPLLPSYSSRYDIYKRNPSDADFLFHTGVPNLSFVDTIDICQNTVAYKITLSDLEANCRNVSRIQSDIFTDMTYPSMPQLDSVSVDFNTGQTVLGWSPSSSADAIAYIIYYQDDNDFWVPIDTVYGINNTFWTDLSHDPNASIYRYRIAALDACWNSTPMTEPQKTMKLSHNLDICAQTAHFSWAPYENMRGGLAAYKIYFSRDGGPLEYGGQTTPPTTTYTLTNLQPNSFYKVVVKAVNGDGSITATSAADNFQFIVTESAHFAYLRYVTVSDEKLELAIHTSGDTLEFARMLLYRSVDNSGNFVLYATIPYGGGSEYFFTDAEVNINSKLYYYRADIISECDIVMAQSNIGHNIVISGVADEAHRNTLQWPAYGDWEAGVNGYSIFRRVQVEDFFVEFDYIAPNNFNSYQDDVSDLFKYGSDFYYYVEAVEAPNSFGFVDRSRSNLITLRQMPTTYIPNAFKPYANVNNVFMPINSFVSTANYSFFIYSRSGEVIFYTYDPYKGWDGTSGGAEIPVGIYVYVIKYLYPDGTPYEKIGTVTLLR